MRKYIAPTVLVLLLGTIVGGWYFIYSTKVLASGIKNDWVRPFTYGYKLEQYRFRSIVRLTFWTEDKMHFTYEKGWLSVQNVVEERWLPRDRAIYLHLNIVHHDSDGDRVYPAKILYDFYQGQLYASSDLSLWRGVIGEDWRSEKLMSEDEFQQVLSRLSQ